MSQKHNKESNVVSTASLNYNNYKLKMITSSLLATGLLLIGVVTVGVLVNGQVGPENLVQGSALPVPPVSNPVSNASSTSTSVNKTGIDTTPIEITLQPFSSSSSSSSSSLSSASSR